MHRLSRRERSQILRAKNGTRRVSIMRSGTIVPPRDVQATVRYTLPTRTEIFRYSQMVNPAERLAETSGKVGSTTFHHTGQSRPTMGSNSERYVNGR